MFPITPPSDTLQDLTQKSPQNSVPPWPSFDVLVVGTGAAGLYAALCLPPQLQVGLLTKTDLTTSASRWAQGGIAAVTSPKDEFIDHIEDTLRAGAGLCNRDAVAFLVHHAPECIQRLLTMGVAFDRQGEQLALTLEAGHSHHRVLHAADTTGRALVETLTTQLGQRPNIQVIPQAFVVDLWRHPITGTCQGVSVLQGQRLWWLRSRAVVLATGGGGQVFAETTNPDVSTGDGVAIAWRAGVKLRDLEFVQFHPTALKREGAPRFLITEAVRGEGAHLVDHTGRRFAFDYHPAGELAPRDVVSRGIFTHLQRTAVDPKTAQVWLDLRPIPVATIRHRFPNIIQVCQHWGIDVFQEPIPVAPAAHYWMGGMVTDRRCQTSLPGLYGVGEVASTGVHGANRLASNSLLECLVFGAELAHITLNPETSVSLGSVTPLELAPKILQDWPEQRAAITTIRTALPQLVWQSAGICREQAPLEQAIAQVEDWRQTLGALPISQVLTQIRPPQAIVWKDPNLGSQLQTWGEARNLLDVAHLLLKSALFRCESRGGHYRYDYPDPDLAWKVHTLVRGDGWWTVPPLSDP